jgi:hypothetical protein
MSKTLSGFAGGGCYLMATTIQIRPPISRCPRALSISGRSFRNRRGHGSLPTRAIILSKGGISARCYYERGER